MDYSLYLTETADPIASGVIEGAVAMSSKTVLNFRYALDSNRGPNPFFIYAVSPLTAIGMPIISSVNVNDINVSITYLFPRNLFPRTLL